MRTARALIAAATLMACVAAGPARGAGVQVLEAERAWAQWSGGAGCVRSFVHVLGERSRVIDPPGAPAGAAVAWVSIVKADACTGAVVESSTGFALVRGLRIGPGGAALRATVPLEDLVSGTVRSVRVDVAWTVTGTAEASVAEHDAGVVRIQATSSDATATGSVSRDTGAAAKGDAVAAGIMTFRRLAAGANG